MSDFHGPLTGYGWLICGPLAVITFAYLIGTIVQGVGLVREVRRDRRTR